MERSWENELKTGRVSIPIVTIIFRIGFVIFILSNCLVTALLLVSVNKNERGKIIVRIERSIGYSQKVEQAIRDEARIRLGDTMAVVFDYDSPIEKETNGKFRFIVQSQKLFIKGGQNRMPEDSVSDGST